MISRRHATGGCGSPFLAEASKRGDRLLVWGVDSVPPDSPDITVLWSAFCKNESPRLISIPKLVEDNDSILRGRYLKWIYELGEIRVNRGRLIDQLKLRPDFSYWWMTQLAEKSFAKSPRLYDALRFMALADLLVKSPPRCIALVSDDPVLVEVFRDWCKCAGMIFEWRPLNINVRKTSLLAWTFSNLPFFVQAILSLLKYAYQRWSLKIPTESSAESPTADIAFVSYFDNLDAGASAEGRFSSLYWANLPEVLATSGLGQEWIHVYADDGNPRLAKSARMKLSQFQKNGPKELHHSFLDGNLSFDLLWKSFKDYLSVRWKIRRIKNVERYFSYNDSGINFWPLFRKDWINSFYGSAAMFNCLYLNLFETALKRSSHRKLGFYLQENQAWEIAFNYAWKTFGHGKLVGVAHSTVRFWDLRYFNDPRNLQNGMPRPDFVALNSKVARESYLKAGYPASELLEVEALRYLKLVPRAVPQPKRSLAVRPLRILICGDYLPAATAQQMDLMVQAFHDAQADWEIMVKPHPNCPIDGAMYPSLKFKLVEASINDLQNQFDVGYTSNITSAALDVYLLCKPVITILSPFDFNMSPVRGFSEVKFVSSSKELIAAIAVVVNGKQKLDFPTYFNIDPALPRWASLIEQMLDE